MTSRLSRLFQLLLVLLILAGAAMRFTRRDWNEGANLHPDEYGLTNTLTQLRLPASLTDYFNTRLSPLSPYQRYDEAGAPIADGPDNGMRWGQWPMILLRATAEWSGNTGYDALRLMGRTLSAIADLLVLLLIFAIGQRLYGRLEGLLAAALYALAALPIQQSHFMTVDAYGGLFSTLAMYAAVRAAQTPLARRRPAGVYRLNPATLGWSLLFGVAFGMALASKINLVPLGGLLLVTLLIAAADLPLRRRADLRAILVAGAATLVVAGLGTLLVFRLTQPMSFRAAQGDTTLLTLRLNPDWLRNMQAAQRESSGIGGGPPAEQWSRRPLVIFPLLNMVLWGMSLPLGLAVWAGTLAAAWLVVRYGRGWRTHLLPLVWALGFFAFMGTRWVSSIRYFLPIYPFLCLLAAWGLLAWLRSARANGRNRWLPQLALGLVLVGTFTWATAFTHAVYGQANTRVRASRWIFSNVPGPVQLTITGADGQTTRQPLPAPNGLRITAEEPYQQHFTAAVSGQLSQALLPHVSTNGGESVLRLAISSDPQGREVLSQVELSVVSEQAGPAAPSLQASFPPVQLEAGSDYYLTASVTGDPIVTLWQTVIAGENWDEGLPSRIDGWDPFSQLYRGATMQVRWADDAAKRQSLLEVLDQTDYLILASQRGLWSTCRLPLTYPMTIAYYRALFAGQLGFHQAASFSAPIQIGPLYVSDVAGSVAWGHAPVLPVFNHSWLAAEEAFSVYDHPPVWIFQKDDNFSLAAAADVLDAIDLNQVVVQSPREATGPICP